MLNSENNNNKNGCLVVCSRRLKIYGINDLAEAARLERNSVRREYRERSALAARTRSPCGAGEGAPGALTGDRMAAAFCHPLQGLGEVKGGKQKSSQVVQRQHPKA